MQIIDVMRRLNTEHEIRFLLTAYLETLRGSSAHKRLPSGVAVLPLKDGADVEARFGALLDAELCGLTHLHCDAHSAIATEATQIFGAAFTRLQTLRENASGRVAHASLERAVSPDAAQHHALVV